MKLQHIESTHARTPDLGQERLIVLFCLVGVTGAAWVWLGTMAADIGVAPASDMPMPQFRPLTAAEAWVIFAMWTVMMVGMMLPGAAPMSVLFTTINQRKHAAGQPFVSTGIFVLGYLIVWIGFCVAATAFQWGLHAVALLSPGMEGTSTILGGSLLIGAGLYQWTPLKFACLKRCRSPLHFILASWRDGTAGALRMGVKHGAYCLGCCWMLMGLMFVGGVMNLLWAAAIAVFVLAEKVLSHGLLITRASGVALIAAGYHVLASS
jgi:predicted metal-binding membrane protein